MSSFKPFFKPMLSNFAVGGDFNFSGFLNCKKLTSFSLTYDSKYTEHFFI